MKPGCTVMIPQDRGIHFNWGSVHHFSFFFFFFYMEPDNVQWAKEEYTVVQQGHTSLQYRIRLSHHGCIMKSKARQQGCRFLITMWWRHQCYCLIVKRRKMDRYSILTSNCWGGRACFDSLFVFIFFFFTHNACKTPRLEICMNNLPFFYWLNSEATF